MSQIAGSRRQTTPPNTPAKLAKDILRCKGPTYFNPGRAWVILGYYQRQKPTVADFVQDMTRLWNFLIPLNTLTGRRARAYILDALRTLGFRNACWHVNKHDLDLTHQDQDGSWATLPDPPRGGRQGHEDAREYFLAQAPRASTCEFDHKGRDENAVWRDLHKYQGFTVFDKTPNKSSVAFRAFPAPAGADSLWHSVSYWLYRRARHPTKGTPRGGCSMWDHWQVKARIWTYLMQVLMDHTHVRWADYHMLQHQSKSVDHDFGTLSMARALYASQYQGKPAYPHPYILYVIADYFQTEVVVFKCDGIHRSYNQGSCSYSQHIYGHRPKDSPYPQILIASNTSGTHYDPVDFDLYPLHEIPGYDADDDVDLLPDEVFPTVKGSGDMWGGQRAPLPWPTPVNDRVVLHPLNRVPPCEEARYNYLRRGERDAFDQQFANGVIPRNMQRRLPIVLKFAPGRGTPGIVGRMAHHLDARYGEVILTDEVWGRFGAGIDIPGWGFDIPADDLDDWQDNAAHPAGHPGFLNTGLGWQWRFGPDPMGLGWPSAVNQPSPPTGTVEKGKHMLDDPYVVHERDKWRVEKSR